MKKIKLCKPVSGSVLIGTGLLLGAMQFAQAADAKPSPLLVRVTAIVIEPDASSDALDLDVPGIVDLAVDFTYFINPNLGLNLLATFLNPEVEAGGNSLGSVGLVPPILTLQYHFNPRPTSLYVGGGFNYNIFHSETGSLDDINGGLAGGKVEVDDTIGYVLQAGMDIELTKHTSLNLDLKFLSFEADVELDGNKADDLEFDAFIVGLGLGWHL